MTEAVGGTAGAARTGLAGPRWGLPRGVIILLGIASLVVTVAGIRATAWMIGPAFLALIIVIAVAPSTTSSESWYNSTGKRKNWL